MNDWCPLLSPGAAGVEVRVVVDQASSVREASAKLLDYVGNGGSHDAAGWGDGRGSYVFGIMVGFEQNSKDGPIGKTASQSCGNVGWVRAAGSAERLVCAVFETRGG